MQLQSDLAKTKARMVKLQKNAEELKVELEKRRSSAHHEKGSTTRMKELEEQAEVDQTQIEVLRGEIEDLKEELNVTQNAREAAQEEVEQRDEEISRLRKDIDIPRSDESRDEGLSRKDEEITKLKEEVNSLRLRSNHVERDRTEESREQGKDGAGQSGLPRSVSELTRARENELSVADIEEMQRMEEELVNLQLSLRDERKRGNVFREVIRYLEKKNKKLRTYSQKNVERQAVDEKDEDSKDIEELRRKLTFFRNAFDREFELTEQLRFAKLYQGLELTSHLHT
jgi:hypothetical protein